MIRSSGTPVRLALAGAACTAAAAATLLGAEVASAAPAGTTADCGFTSYHIRSTLVQAYNHCGPTTVRIHVDMRGHGSANDYNLCVGPGMTDLSYSVDVLNAYYTGGAGCPKGRRS